MLAARNQFCQQQQQQQNTTVTTRLTTYHVYNSYLDQ